MRILIWCCQSYTVKCEVKNGNVNEGRSHLETNVGGFRVKGGVRLLLLKPWSFRVAQGRWRRWYRCSDTVIVTKKKHSHSQDHVEGFQKRKRVGKGTPILFIIYERKYIYVNKTKKIKKTNPAFLYKIRSQIYLKICRQNFSNAFYVFKFLPDTILMKLFFYIND